MSTTQYFDSIHEQLYRVNNKLKEINTTIDKLMDEMVEMGWMEREEKTGEINKIDSTQNTTYGEGKVNYVHSSKQNKNKYE
jgi:polyhydroxyalkanoate synthesis regulator phasin